MPSAEQLLRTAAAPTLERIRQDHENAPPTIKPLLAYLEKNLFDPNLDAKRLMLACEVRDNSLPIHFHNALGSPPYAYILGCRFDIACLLLEKTRISIWKIAQLLGFSTIQVFSRAFEQWSGIRPMEYRKLAEESSPVLSAESLRRAVRGELKREEADSLNRQLAGLYPESFFIPAGEGAVAW